MLVIERGWRGYAILISDDLSLICMSCACSDAMKTSVDATTPTLKIDFKKVSSDMYVIMSSKFLMHGLNFMHVGSGRAGQFIGNLASRAQQHLHQQHNQQPHHHHHQQQQQQQPAPPPQQTPPPQQQQSSVFGQRCKNCKETAERAAKDVSFQSMSTVSTYASCCLTYLRQCPEIHSRLPSLRR